MIDFALLHLDFVAGIIAAVGVMLVIHELHDWRATVCSVVGHDDWTQLRKGAPVGGMQHMVAVDVCRRCGREAT